MTEETNKGRARPITQADNIPYRGFAALMAIAVPTFGVAIIISMVTLPEIDDWYHDLTLPSWNPPDWLFSPVWTFLYLSMTIAAFRVWRRLDFEREGARLALISYAVQLGLNLLWPIFFFRLHLLAEAAFEIALLFVAIVVTILLFRRVDRRAAALLLPYLVWVAYAGSLSWAIFLGNGQPSP